MSKKNFKGGLDSLLGENGKSSKTTTPIKKTIEKVKQSNTRATFVVDEVLLDKIRAIAYWERSEIKDIVNQSFSDTVKKYEKKNGPIEPMPKK